MTIDEPLATSPASDETWPVLLQRAADLVVLDQFGSLPRLQRRLEISHDRATAVMAALEDHGIVAPELNGMSRRVLVTPDQLPEVLERLRHDEWEPGP